jgi:hypothetical protein
MLWAVTPLALAQLRQTLDTVTGYFEADSDGAHSSRAAGQREHSDTQSGLSGGRRWLRARVWLSYLADGAGSGGSPWYAAGRRKRATRESQRDLRPPSNATMG